MPRLRGVIADDFTGATDIAAAYTARGYRTVVVIGVPTLSESDPPDPGSPPEGTSASPVPPVSPEIDVVVIALKSRTASVERARQDALQAWQYLHRLGFNRFYFKYCSTFDSTDAGNIGPVLDVLREASGASRVVVIPAFPDNGRTVYQGNLFVGNQLLEHSSMRHHPLTPMTRSRVSSLLAPQTSQWVGEIYRTEVSGPDGGIEPRLLQAALRNSADTYLVIDALNNADLRAIADVSAQDTLISGGSGLALGTSTNPASALPAPTTPDIPTAQRSSRGRRRRLILTASASARTREQVQMAIEAGYPTRCIDADRASADAAAEVQRALEWLAAQTGDLPALITAVGPSTVVDPQGSRAQRVEEVLAGVAVGAVAAGYDELIVGGGETSGAITLALGIRTLCIQGLISPGVCWARAHTALEERPIWIALKSGNFGEPRMFLDAWEHLG